MPAFVCGAALSVVYVLSAWRPGACARRADHRPTAVLCLIFTPRRLPTPQADKPVWRNNWAAAYTGDITEPSYNVGGPAQQLGALGGKRPAAKVSPWRAVTRAQGGHMTVHVYLAPPSARSQNTPTCTNHSRSSPTPQDLWLKTEYQTLRRFPKSRAILFTIRTLVQPMPTIGAEAAATLHKSLSGMRPELRAYKGVPGEAAEELLEMLEGMVADGEAAEAARAPAPTIAVR